MQPDFPPLVVERLGVELLEMCRGEQHPGRRRLLDLARRRCEAPLLSAREGWALRAAALTHVQGAWELLTVPGAECPVAAGLALHAAVAVLDAMEHEEILDGPRGMAPWAHELGIVEFDGEPDYERGGYADQSQWSTFGKALRAQLEARS